MPGAIAEMRVWRAREPQRPLRTVPVLSRHSRIRVQHRGPTQSVEGMRRDRAAQSRGPSGDATAARDAGAAFAVAGIRFAARSRFAGPSGNAQRRPNWLKTPTNRRLVVV